jgi:phospholipid transport system transporter-binding protein
MLLLPATITLVEANDTRRLLVEALKADTQSTTLIDASNLTHFDSSALAVLLECHRAADAWGKPFELRNAPPKLASLAKLYGVDVLLGPTAAKAAPAQTTAP